MCVRFSVWRIARAEWRGYDLSYLIGQVDQLSQQRARYNAALTQELPVIGPQGLHTQPFGTLGPQGKRLGNARSDKLLGYWRRWMGQRCLIPANGYFEWAADKQPWYFTHRELPVFCFAGLSTPDGFVIITTDANAETVAIHPKMPVILPPGVAEQWMDPAVGPAQAAELAAPLSAGHLTRWRVSKAVGNVRNDGPELIEPVADTGLFPN